MATIYANDNEKKTEAARRYLAACRIGMEPVEKPKLIKAVIC